MDMKPLKQIMDLSGKSAIVTGGAMGIGFGIAWRLAEAGAGVLIADMDQKTAEGSAARLKAEGWKAAALRTDVANAADVQQMVAAAVKAYGGVDILVNNAGIYPNVPLMQLTEKDFEHILAVNLRGVFLCTQAAASQMIKQGRGGSIINISSIDAIHPSMVGLATYDATKHGVWGFTKNTALELAVHRIAVNAIAPGVISTPGTGAGKPVSKEFQDQVAALTQKVPMRRMGEPDDIGKVALFLASGLSGYMTGSQVVVDGGVLLA